MRAATIPGPPPPQAGEAIRESFADVEVVRFRPAGTGGSLPRGQELAPSSFLLLYALGECAVTCAPGAQLWLRTGDCSVGPSGPVATAGPAVDLLVISIPDSAVGVHRRTLASVAGHVFATRQGTPGLVGRLLAGLADQLGHYAPSNPSRLAHHLVGMFTLMCAEDAGTAKPQLLERSEEYIESHLGDVDLTPDRIAEALHVSSRTLHRIFEAEGITIGAWIRNRRLEQCRMDLADAMLAEVPVSHIASRWGLWDASHFSRLFKACFGLSPRAYRLANAAPPAPRRPGGARSVAAVSRTA
jgi:AraC-like DNA-binding protein